VRSRKTPRAHHTGEPIPYDFRRPLTMPRDHARHLEMAFERFGRGWATQLTARLRAVAEITLDDLSLATYEEYVRSLPTPTVLVVCHVGEPRTTALLQLPSDVVMVWLDYLLGGTGLGDARERELTDMEVALLKDLLGHAFGDFSYAFASVVPLRLDFSGVQYNPQFVQAAAAGETMMVARFTLAIGGRSDPATLMMAAEPVLTALRAAGDGPIAADETDIETQLRLDEALAGAPVDVAVRLAPVPVRPRQILELAVGDILPFHHPRTQPLDVVVDDVIVARAALGARGSRLACQVVTVEEKP
jgi:flagellar motor switch protein FliM